MFYRNVLLFLVLPCTLSACASFAKLLTVPASPPPVATVETRILTPKLELAPNKQALITQGRISITVEPIIPESIRKVAVADSATTGNCAMANGCYFYRQHIPYYMHPGKLMFSIKIENNLEQPLRLNNALMALRIGNKDVPKEEYRESFDELSNSTILPGSIMESKFNGHAYSSIPDSTDIIFAFYDVTTELDAASNPTKRSAFVWQYKYSSATEIKKDEIQYQCMRIVYSTQCTGDARGACPESYERCAREGVDRTPLAYLLQNRGLWGDNIRQTVKYSE